METVESSNDTKAPTNSGRRIVHAAVALWRLGSEDYFQSVDSARPPPLVVSDDDPAIAPVSAFDNSRELANLVEKALLRTNEVLSMPIDQVTAEPDEQNARARVLLSAVRTVLQTQLRADDNVLKRRATTAHTKMLRDLKTLKNQMGGAILDAAE